MSFRAMVGGSTFDASDASLFPDEPLLTFSDGVLTAIDADLTTGINLSILGANTNGGGDLDFEFFMGDNETFASIVTPLPAALPLLAAALGGLGYRARHRRQVQT